MEQQAHFFLQGHLADQVGDAGLHRQAPVFIRIQLTVLVQILELVFTLREDRGFAGSQFGLGEFWGAPREEAHQKEDSQQHGFFHGVHFQRLYKFTEF